MRVAVLCHTNLYESKLHFGVKFGEALERAGVEVLYLDITGQMLEGELARELLGFKAKLTLSFNSFTPDKRGKYFWEYLQVPHLSILVDPPIYYREMTRSQHSLFACVDELDVKWLHQKGVKHSFFLPHAIERELNHPPEAERPLDVVLIGSCYDPGAAQRAAEDILTPELFQVYEIAVQRTMAEAASPFEFVIDEELAKRGIVLDDEGLRKLSFYVDTYIRGKERLDLVASIRDATVHIFGEKGWMEDYGAESWSVLLADQPNVVFHPGVPYKESLEILKQAKISLNSMPFFKQGTHERLFASLAAGSLPFTTDNLWVQKHFRGLPTLNQANERINDFLAHPEKRISLARWGQQETLEKHTWDQRAHTLLEVIGGA